MSIYYNYDKIMSFPQKFKIITGERGIGKSYGAKLLALRRGVKTHKLCFVWVRKTETQVKELKSKFLTDIKKDPIFKDVSFEVKGNGIFLKDEFGLTRIGEFIALSTSENLKSSSYDDVTLLVFDEFTSQERMKLSNEITIFCDLLESVFRTRENYQVLLLSNAMTTLSPYYDLLKIKINKDGEFTKNDICVCQYCISQAFRDFKKNTTLGKLFENTEYGEHAIENKFILDDETNVMKLKGYKSYLYGLVLNGVKIGVWYMNGGSIYISNDYFEKETKYTIYINDMQQNEDCNLLTKKSQVFNYLKKKHYEGIVFFETLKIKNEVVEMMIALISSYR